MGTKPINIPAWSTLGKRCVFLFIPTLFKIKPEEECAAVASCNLPPLSKPAPSLLAVLKNTLGKTWPMSALSLRSSFSSFRDMHANQHCLGAQEEKTGDSNILVSHKLWDEQKDTPHMREALCETHC